MSLSSLSSNPLGLSAVSLLQEMAANRISAEEYAHEVLAKIRQHADLNAVQSYNDDLLIQQARQADTVRQSGAAGSLTGLPFVAKDNINTTAFPTSGGTSALLNNTPETNAGVIDDLLGAGAVLGGKAAMHELAFGITSNNAVTGPVRNPHDPTRISGGSSGGTAAAIAAGIFPVGLGTDTGGSCRIPAALCGVTGFRPTTGRYKGSGIIPISHTRDTAGLLARCVADITLLDGVIASQSLATPAVDLSTCRIGLPQEVFYEGLEPAVENAVMAQIKALEAAGVTFVDVSMASIWPHNEAFSFPVVFYEVMRDLPAYLKQHAPAVSFEALVAGIKSPDVAGAIASQLGDGAMPQSAYDAAINQCRPAMRKIYADVFKQQQLNAILFPTTPLVASPIGEDETVVLNGEQVPVFPTYIRNTDLGSNLGAPGITLPCPVEGLPVGLEIDGLAGGDNDLLALAHAIERVLS